MKRPLPDRPRVVITGGGSGLGLSLAQAFARRGGRLVLADIMADRLPAAARAVEALGGEVITYAGDVAKEETHEALAQLAEDHFGGTDVLINNAGIAVGGRVGEVELDRWRQVIDINLWGVIYGCHAFVPRMTSQGQGWILNVASAAGLLAPGRLGPYNVTKAGVVALSETLAAEGAEVGISVSVLCPTFFRTRLVEATGGADDKMRRVIEGLMDRSKIQADDVAAAGVRALEQGELYVLPMSDGRWYWRLKRALPNRYTGLSSAALKLLKR